MKYILPFAVFFGLSVAHAKVTDGITFKGSNRLSLAYTYNVISNITSSNIVPFDRANGISTAYEVGMPFSLCINLLYLENRDVRVNWKGAANTPVEFYGYALDLAAKFTLPIGAFQPWIGAGYGWGVLTFSNPQDRETNSGMIGIYSRGSRSAFGPFGYGGLDIMIGTSGIRLAYTLRAQSTDTSSQIGNQNYNMTIGSVHAGIFVNM